MAQKGLVGLFKKGWNTIPEIIGASFMAILGLGIGGAGLYNYYAKDGDNRQYKFEYVVIRPDDPRASKVRTGERQ